MEFIKNVKFVKNAKVVGKLRGLLENLYKTKFAVQKIIIIYMN